MEADEVSIDEMSVPDSAWTTWKHSQDVDTGGLCDCGHEGLGPGWHGNDCQGANFALVTKVQKLINELYKEWALNHSEHCNNIDYDHADGSECLYLRPTGLSY
jgi:hypothetical protein